MVPVIIAFVVGFLVNWSGTGSFFRKEALAPPAVDSTLLKKTVLLLLTLRIYTEQTPLLMQQIPFLEIAPVKRRCKDTNS